MPNYVLLPLLLVLVIIAGFAVYSIYIHRIKPVNPATLSREQSKAYTNDLFWCVAVASLVIVAGLTAYEAVQQGV